MEVAQRIVSAAKKCFGNDLEYIAYERDVAWPPTSLYTVKVLSQPQYMYLKPEETRMRVYEKLLGDIHLNSYEVRLVGDKYEALIPQSLSWETTANGVVKSQEGYTHITLPIVTGDRVSYAVVKTLR